MKPISITVALSAGLLAATLVGAQAHGTNHTSTHGQASAAPPTAAASMPAQSTASLNMADAEVRKVDKDARKVTLKHGPIKNLDMPGMTMVFQIKDDTLFDKLKAGEKIRFSAEQQQGAYVVTRVEKGESK